MSRWHKSTCGTPDVHLDGSLLRCRACCADCKWQDLVPDEDDALLPPIPPNEPAGQRNLRWPPDVPYAEPKTNELNEQDSVDTLAEHVPATSGRSLVYGDALGPDEFRLICLSARKDEERSALFPVHISLETYNHAQCPEYESLSYSWGGEEGDNARCRPVFVGPFWDVLFQTRNCWEMLRFIQPYRGIRMVWIDALCIDQMNPIERGHQVAKMFQIYQECSRVIIYLGPQVSLQNPLPRRCRLSQLQEGQLHPEIPNSDVVQRLSYLLGRRYFSRIWIIQELILAPRAIVRLGNIDFLIDPMVMDELTVKLADQNWNITSAPWFQYAGRRHIPLQSLHSIVHLTSKSQASDPRDRIFAILGLMGNKEPELQPDYTISAAHVFLGFFAYCILNLRKADLLSKARGLTSLSSSPNWIPDWESEEGWENIFKEELAQDSHHNEELNASADRPYYLWKFIADCNYDIEDEFYKSLKNSKFEFLHPRLRRPKLRPWYLHGAVHSDTGTLSITLTRLCTLTSCPVPIIGSENLQTFEMCGSSSSMYLTSASDLGVITCPGEDHIFILDPGNSSELIYLILRKQGLPNTFSLVASCKKLVLSFGERTSLPRLRSEPGPLSLQDFRRSARHAFYTLRILLTWDDVKLLFDMYDEHRIGREILGEGNGLTNFSIYRGILNAKTGSSPGILQSYLSCATKFHPRIKGDCILVGRPSSKYEKDNTVSFSDGVTFGFRRLRSLGAKSGDPYSPSDVSASIKIKDLICWLVSFTRPEIELMESLMRSLKIGIDELEDLLRTKGDLGVEYEDVGCPKEDLGAEYEDADFPKRFQTIQQDFDIDGSTFQVHIL